MTNPYAKKDGSPLSGKEVEFWNWEKNKEAQRMNKLKTVDRKKEQVAKNELTRRMES